MGKRRFYLDADLTGCAIYLGGDLYRPDPAHAKSKRRKARLRKSKNRSHYR
jgi:hypothetical protein